MATNDELLKQFAEAKAFSPGAKEGTPRQVQRGSGPISPDYQTKRQSYERPPVFSTAGFKGKERAVRRNSQRVKYERERRDAADKINLARIGEQGSTSRAAMQERGANARTRLQQDAQTARGRMTQQGESARQLASFDQQNKSQQARFGQQSREQQARFGQQTTRDLQTRTWDREDTASQRAFDLANPKRSKPNWKSYEVPVLGKDGLQVGNKFETKFYDASADQQPGTQGVAAQQARERLAPPPGVENGDQVIPGTDMTNNEFNAEADRINADSIIDEMLNESFQDEPAQGKSRSFPVQQQPVKDYTPALPPAQTQRPSFGGQQLPQSTIAGLSNDSPLQRLLNRMQRKATPEEIAAQKAGRPY